MITAGEAMPAASRSRASSPSEVASVISSGSVACATTATGIEEGMPASSNADSA